MSKDKIKQFCIDNAVLLMFIVLCVGGIWASRASFNFLAGELTTRIFRNSFIVLALIVPIVAGMGINFGIVIGAMTAQLGIILVTHWGISGIQGILVVMLICTPLSMIFGFLCGNLLNRMKGQEMIGSLIMGYFSNGIYQFITLFAFGTIIPMVNKKIMISGGRGIKNTIDLNESVKYGFDKLYQMSAIIVIFALIALAVTWQIYNLLKEKKAGNMLNKNKRMGIIVLCLVLLGFCCIPKYYATLYYINIPMATFGMIMLALLFNNLILTTRFGHAMRTVGQNRVVANAAGINVERTRIIAIMISTVLASWGQLISLQNIGTMQTYGAHEQVGLFAGASLLVGGATVYKATNTQAIIGMILFHTLFVISPLAGKYLLNNAQLGEYFRVFVAYGVICVSLMMHAWRQNKNNKK